MRLSEAVRLSTTMGVPAIYGPIYKRSMTGKICGACRIGAVALAIGYKPPRQFVRWDGEISESINIARLFKSTWPWWDRALGREDVPYTMYLGAAAFVAYCHEHRKMTADQIATELEQLEAKYADEPVTIDVTPNRAGDALQLEEVL